ncbi:MAG TPA: ATP-binding protein [Spirochaetota bacterium]|nr:ATP-binding protein [Spirochaetota bacterium]HPQ52908.1 ATP-binding protein [Spirochaetota bacterium]
MPDDNRITIPNTLKDTYSFEEIINLREKLFSENISHIDMSRVGFIEPYSMVSFAILGREYLRNTGKKLTLVNIPLNINQYLYRMDFFKTGIFENTDKLDPKYYFKRSSLSKSVIEITEIPGKERESIRVISDVIATFRKRADNILKYWLFGSIVDYFVTVISEICQNIFEHSIDSGFLAMQTYSYSSEHIVRLVISDSGVGIRESFTGKKEISVDSTASLIEKVLTTPLSSKRDFGYGLCQVNTIVEKLGGSIYIRSDDASVSVVHNKKYNSTTKTFQKTNLAPFPGTQLSVTLTT